MQPKCSAMIPLVGVKTSITLGEYNQLSRLGLLL